MQKEMIPLNIRTNQKGPALGFLPYDLFFELKKKNQKNRKTRKEKPPQMFNQALIFVCCCLFLQIKVAFSLTLDTATENSIPLTEGLTTEKSVGLGKPWESWDQRVWNVWKKKKASVV